MKKNFLLFFIFLTFYGTLSAQKKLPNILWIITDDQRPDAIAAFNQVMYGSKENRLGYVSSPNIDALAKEGVLFVNAYCNSPACSPSRSSMITGQYPWHNGVYGFEPWNNGLAVSKPFITDVLRDRGYQTIAFGKTGLTVTQKKADGYKAVYEQYVNKKQYLMTKGFADEDHNKSAEVFYFPDGTKKSFPDKNLTEEQKKEKEKFEKDYNILRAHVRGVGKEEIYGGQSPQTEDKTIDASILKEYSLFFDNPNQNYLSQSKAKMKGLETNKPVMIQLGFSFPHTPILPPKRFRDMFKDKVYHLPEFNKSENDLLPPQLRKLYFNMKIDGFTNEEMEQEIRDYYAFNAFGDELVGKAVKRFKDYCKRKNEEYLIVFTGGDNGWHLREQGLGAKFAPYDISNHECAIVVSSNKNVYPAGKVVKDFVEFVDFAPTMFAAAGVNLKDNSYNYLDGDDLANVVSGTAKKLSYVLGEMNWVYGPRAYIRSHEFAFSMRTRPTDAKVTQPLLKDIKWALDAPEKDVEMTLYDLRNDPYERKNVANQSKYQKLAGWFRKKLGDIVLGDNRIQADFDTEKFEVSSFAAGADDKKLNIPQNIIPTL